MGLADFFGIFKSEAAEMREKIIFTQKSRITKLENQISDAQRMHERKSAEIDRVRDQSERSRDKLVSQIVSLSDKFADLNHKMLDIAHENSRLKLLVESKKRPRKR